MEWMIIAGEASGDAYAAEVVTELRRRHPDWRFFGCGGKRLAETGAEILVSADQLGVVGLLEVVTHLPRIYGFFRRLRQAMLARRPAAVILIDFPDFNLRFAKAAHRAGVPVLYFVSPQLWAWRSGRVKQIRKTVRRMICIFPFEEDFYRRHQVAVAAVGHPLVERIAAARRRFPPEARFREENGLPLEAELIALLPGSRHRELEFHLPALLQAAAQLHAETGAHFVLPVAPSLSPESVAHSIPAAMREYVHLLPPAAAYAGIACARLAIVASGTATVETALLGTPMIVIYRLSPWTYRLGRSWVKVPHYAMVNLIAGREAVPELIQEGLSAAAIVNWAHRLLPDGKERQQMRLDLEQVSRQLGEPGAIARAASAMEETVGIASTLGNVTYE
ncbi:MAG TPA: lipid-A-disaccharide synthase [Terriglobales bacterium]|nr:lipid-A-disaccharide synthase [Terriglobales bacterium]